MTREGVSMEIQRKLRDFDLAIESVIKKETNDLKVTNLFYFEIQKKLSDY